MRAAVRCDARYVTGARVTRYRRMLCYVFLSFFAIISFIYAA